MRKIFRGIILFLTFTFPIMAVNAAGKITRVSCGNVTGIPKKIPQLTNDAVRIVQVAVPVILIIMGTVDLIKGITAQDDKEIKKGQQLFIKRLIIGAIIFFVIVIVKFVISIVADSSSANIAECIDCFLNSVKECK